MTNQTPKVGIIMGSDSDLSVMNKAADILKEFNVPYELTIMSAHRTPKRVEEYSSTAEERGLTTIICAAGVAAHLAGVVAAFTKLPVIAVPIKASMTVGDGLDSLLSMVQMPPGIPVATVGVDNALNAGLLALQIIGTSDKEVSQKLQDYKDITLKEKVMKAVEKVKAEHPNFFDQ